MTSTTTIYDSAAPTRPLVDQVRNLWENRALIRLLVIRDLTVRYKRSVLGVWWTVLNPIFTSAVMWLVFDKIFGRVADEVPFIVYALTGVLFISAFFSQGVLSAGSSLLGASGILSKMRVPGEVFAFTAALAAAVNFLLGLIPLFIIMAVLPDVSIPWTVILLPIPTVLMLCLITGIGLVIASLAVHFHDVLDLVRVVLQLVIWLVPTFYPIRIIPEQLVWIVKINPLYSFLTVFRAYMYEASFGAPVHYLVMIGSAAIALAIGVYVFSRSWRGLVVKL